MAGGKPFSTVAFDPFELVAWIRRVRDRKGLTFPGWRSEILLLLLPVITVLAVLVAAVEGTLGGVDDVSPIADLRRVLRVSEAQVSPARLPFVRDYPAWFLAAAIVLTVAIVHYQWKLMKECLPQLGKHSDGDIDGGRRAAVIGPRTTAVTYRPIEVVCGYRRIVNNAVARELFFKETSASADGNELDFLCWRLNAMFRKWRVLSLPLLLVSFGVVSFVLAALREHGFFHVLVPHLSGGERAEWGRQLYDNWWASAKHPAGVALYALVGTVGVFVVILQNIVGLCAVYLVRGIPIFADVRADWRNDDGCHGWSPLANVYRTVRWSLTLHGLTLTMLLVVLGINNFSALWVLVALWSVALFAYTVVPFRVSRRIAREAQEAKIAEIYDALESAPATRSNFAALRLDVEGRAMVGEIRSTQLRILGGGKVGTRVVFLTYIFPIALTAVDIGIG